MNQFTTYRTMIYMMKMLILVKFFSKLQKILILNETEAVRAKLIKPVSA